MDVVNILSADVRTRKGSNNILCFMFKKEEEKGVEGFNYSSRDGQQKNLLFPCVSLTTLFTIMAM